MRCTGLALAVGLVMFGQSAEVVKQEDLVAHYERYDGSEVAVRGEVVSGEEGTVMYLRAGSTDSDAPAGMVILFSEALGRKPGPLEKRFIKALKKAGRVNAILSGRFEGVAERRWGIKRAVDFASRLIE